MNKYAVVSLYKEYLTKEEAEEVKERLEKTIESDWFVIEVTHEPVPLS